MTCQIKDCSKRHCWNEECQKHIEEGYFCSEECKLIYWPPQKPTSVVERFKALKVAAIERRKTEWLLSSPEQKTVIAHQMEVEEIFRND